MNQDLKLQILIKVSHQYGIDQAVGNKIRETKIFNGPQHEEVYQAYLDGYKEGKKQRLKNLLTNEN